MRFAAELNGPKRMVTKERGRRVREQIEEIYRAARWTVVIYEKIDASCSKIYFRRVTAPPGGDRNAGDLSYKAGEEREGVAGFIKRTRATQCANAAATGADSALT